MAEQEKQKTIITRLGAGKDFRKAGPQVHKILDEIAEWIEKREKVKITPDSGVGHIRADGTIDLSALAARVTALERNA